MITENSPEATTISFADWTRDMLALAIKLHRLPRAVGEAPTHEIGIDRLHRLRGGDLAIAALFDRATTTSTIAPTIGKSSG